MRQEDTPSRRDPLLQNQLLTIVPQVTGTLTDGQRVGTFVYVGAFTFSTANTDASIAHQLGRTPNGYFVLSTKGGGVTYNGSNNGTDWTDKAIVLRNTVAFEVVTLLLL